MASNDDGSISTYTPAHTTSSYNHGKESFLEANWNRDNNIMSQKPQLFQHEGYQTSSSSFSQMG